ncbi:phosphotransferase [Bifidobacterium sp. ESL0745]|uniref:phosphotransferase n=1 Tax=Bifidobacterium sp. ESL0745 TaxID=2983226 RepID=UPI0023F6E5F0|nr:phosphotransferase [Bifidobacterium sp. ESL0745]MDF7664621.1 phosphotransferase [Bifidobacterium sp. ESL0745]
MLAALASAAMPETSMAGVREVQRNGSTGNDAGIRCAVVQDTAGRQYDVFASCEDKGKKILAARVRAANVLAKSHEMSGLGFAVDRVLAFSHAGKQSQTEEYSVLVAPHMEGEPRQLDLLTIQDAASVGTTIGAIHRQRTEFLTQAQYPAFTTGQIRAQLTGWIKRLQQAGHVPTAITTSWAKIIETDGLWSFSTTLTHGGFADGDFLFTGSTITAVNNWQDMQINDPARDLAWMFAKLDESHRNALMNAYGSMMGSRVDDLILLRANLWLQMEQVGDFIGALGRADNAKILRFKAQVEHLAHQLTVVTNKAAGAATAASAVVAPNHSKDSVSSSPQSDDDETGESDKTGSAEVTKLVEASDSTADRPVHFNPGYTDDSDDDDRTDDRRPRSEKSEPQYSNMPSPSSSATMVLTEAAKDFDRKTAENEDNLESGNKRDKQHVKISKEKVSWHVQYSQEDDTYSGALPTEGVDHEAPTSLIPQLEREQQALYDARVGIEEAEEKQERRTRISTSSRTDIQSQNDGKDGQISPSDAAKESKNSDQADESASDCSSSSDSIPENDDNTDDSITVKTAEGKNDTEQSTN